MRLLGCLSSGVLSYCFHTFYYSLPLASFFKAVNPVSSLAFDIYLALYHVHWYSTAVAIVQGIKLLSADPIMMDAWGFIIVLPNPIRRLS